MTKRKPQNVAKHHIVIARKMFGGGGALTPAENKMVAMHGSGFFSSIWNGIKSIAGFVKKNKLVSGIAGLIPNPTAQAIAKGAGLVGLGRKKTLKL